MITTDAAVHPYPAGDSSLRRMAIEAHDLGLDSVVAIDGPNTELYGVRVIRGVLISESQVKNVIGQVRRRSGKGDLVIVNAGDTAFNRSVIVIKEVRVLRHIHKSPKNSFDHVAARLAAERGVAIDVDLHPVIHMKGPSRQRVLQKYRDIIRLHARYRFPLTVSSNAYSVLDMRSPDEMKSICRVFGMSDQDVDDALSAAERLLTHISPVQVVG
jgi:ribonuclease P/MRP protein subunit RPP1